MTEYEQKVTRTLYWLTAASHRDALLSSSRGGTRIDWWPEYTLKPDACVQQNQLRQRENKSCTRKCQLASNDYISDFTAWVYLHRHQRAKPRPQYGSRQMAICRDG